MCFGKSDAILDKKEDRKEQPSVAETGLFKKPTPVAPEIPPKTFGNCTL